MRHRKLLLLATLLAVIASALPAQELLEKEKAETYFFEIGVVFLKSDEFDYAPAFLDPDGYNGPLESEPVIGTSGDTFTADPRIVLGMNMPSGKSTIAFTAWEFNAENIQFVESDVTSQVMTPTSTIPSLILTRDAGINFLEDAYASQERDLKYAAGNWERNLHETKKHRTRLIAGVKYVQFEDRLDVANLYGEEVFQVTTTFIPTQDRQQVRGSVLSTRLGPNIGIESRLKLGDRFRLTSRAELTIAEESIVVQYENTAGEVDPRVAIGGGGVSVGGISSPPRGIRNSELIRFFPGGRFDLWMDDTSEHRIVPVGEVSIRGSWVLSRWVEAGLEYRYLGIYDVPSAQGAIETVRDTISPIALEVRNLEDSDPDNDEFLYLYEVDDIVQRHDVIFQGLNFFLVFHF